LMLVLVGIATLPASFSSSITCVSASNAYSASSASAESSCSMASARETKVSDLARLITAALAKVGRGEVIVRHAGPRIGDVLRRYADMSKARRMLGC
jgi:hypothetical protein